MSIEVSIITPAFNASKTIEATYFSIANQTFGNWEWIVVDDCSNDDTIAILESISKKDNRVRYIKSEQNNGAAVARNKGISQARGNFIAFIDADDLWKSTKLEKQLQFMKSRDISISCTDYEISSNGETKVFSPKNKVFDYKDLLKANNIGCSTVVYDSSRIGKRYMPVDAPKREDHAMWLDISKDFPIYKLEEPLAVYSFTENSVSSKKIKMFKYQYLVFRKHEGFGVFKSFWLTICLSYRRIFKKYK